MMKKLLISLAVILGLLLAAVIILPVIFKDDIVEMVKKQANENLNAKVNFNNDIELSLIKNFPNFTLGIKDLSIVGIDEFEGDTLVSWKNFEATIDLMSVIRGEQINVRKILLESPRIHALVLANGKASWDIAKPSADTTTTADTGTTAFKLSLKKLEIKDANIIYDDKTLGMFSQLQGFDYAMSGDFTQDEFLLSIVSGIKSLDVAYGGVRYLNKVNTQLKADINMNMPQMKFVFKENSISLNALTFNFDGMVQMVNDDINMDLKYNAEKASFKELLSLVPGVYTKDFENVKTAGTLDFNGFAKGTYNEKQLPAFAFNLNVNNAMFQYPALPLPVKDIEIKLAVTNPDGNINNTLVDLSRFHMDVAGDAFDARLVAKNVMQDPFIDSWLKGRLNLGNVTKIAPLENGMELKGVITADVTAKGAVSAIEKQNYEAFNATGQIAAQDIFFKSADLPQGFSLAIAQLAFSPKTVALQSFDATIGKSDMKMNGEISNFFPYMFSNGILNGKLNFSSNLIDANQFLSSEEAAPATTAADTASVEAPEIPANINFTLTSRIGKLLYTNMEITDFAGAVVVANQKLSFNNIGLNTLGAAIKMDGYYETTNPIKPTVAIDFGISNLDIQKAFTTFNTVKTVAPIAENMKGSFSTTFNMTSQLDKYLNPVYPTLFATGVLTIPNAEISDVKVFNKIGDALKNDKFKKVAISNVKIDYKVENGRVYTQPFDLKVAGQKLNLSGSTGLDQTIDYKGLVSISRKDLGAVNTALETALKGLNDKAGSNISMSGNVDVGLGLTGTFSDPKITTNLADLAKKEASSLKDQAKDELDRQKKMLEDKARAEADRLKKETEAKAKAEADKLKQKAEEEKERLRKEAEAKAKAEEEKAKKKAEEEAKKKLKGIFK
jgi:hypothetical protein